MSCFVFNALAEKGNGFKNIESITLEKMIKTVSAFVDDADLWVNGKGHRDMMSECSRNMQNCVK